MKSSRALAFALALLAAPAIISAQARASGGASGGVAGGASVAPAASSPAPLGSAKQAALPKGFRGIELGMGLDEVSGLLKKDSLFSYRGPSDVSLLPSPNMSLIEVEGLSFVKRAFFQFYKGKLWVMVLYLNPDKIDHYSLYSSLSEKYGEPSLIDPKEARWEDQSIRLALERPLTLRYMDMAVFKSLNEGSEAKEGAREIERQDFLGGL